MPWEYVERDIFRHPGLLRRLAKQRERIHSPAGTLHATIATSPEPVPFTDRQALRFRPARAGTFWGTGGTCAWFHIVGVVAPEHRGHPHLALILDTDGEALVHATDGRVVGAVTSRLTPVERHGPYRGKTRLDLTPDLIGPDGRVELWLDAGFNGKLLPPLGLGRVSELSLVTVDDDLEALLLDTLTAAYAYAAENAASTGRGRIREALDASWQTWRPGDAASVGPARAALRPVLDGTPDAALTFTAIGHGHLDMAWLWPLRETRRKARRTFTTQVEMLRRYPDQPYGASQPQQFAWVEASDPALFAQITDAAASGRLELQGGFWVEPDTNLPSGESLIRQAVHGQRYWQSRFGRRVRTCWLPDTFGYSANLPQIVRGAGMDSFTTIKLSWNEHNDFPHRSFTWVGIDGTELLVHMPPEGSYTSSATALSLAAAKRYNPEKQLDEALLVFGSGDGGGGPGATHHEVLRRERSLLGLPATRPGTVEAFFDRLRLRQSELPVWRGELYLEKHQGTFTTQGATKAYNRRLEHHLHDVELLAALAWWRGGRDWPSDLLDECWQDVLLHQFHDILPGSSIGRVHREAEARYAEIEAILLAERESLTSADAVGAPVFVNATPARRTAPVRHEGRWYAVDAPPYATVALAPHPADPALTHDDASIGNGLIRATFGPDGSAASLIDLATGREHSAGGLGRLVVHRDEWSLFDAWDINLDYLTKRRDVLSPHRVETFVDGPRVVRRHTYRYGRSSIQQDVIVESGMPWLLFEVQADWHERHRMLRSEHRPSAWADEVVGEIQLGQYARSTRDETPQEKAQFEICAHRWVHLADPRGFGFGLLNHTKYGHRVKDGLVSLNLLRSPIYPDPRADRGRHTFRYAVVGHEGGLDDSRVRELARDLNAPVVVGSGMPWPAFVTVSPSSVVLETVKRAEDGSGLILRLYETTGSDAVARLEFADWFGPVGTVREANLLEDDLGPVDVGAVAFGPFQIRTLHLAPRD